MAKIKGIAALRAAGGLRELDPVKVEVDWKNDEGEDFTFDVWIKPMAFGTSLDLQKFDDPKNLASAIAAFVLMEDEFGNQMPIDFETARSFHAGLGLALIGAFNKVNTPRKNSQPPTNSSANSSSTESAAEPSQKPETT